MSRTFEAKYRGKCVACGETIHEGDVIRYNDAGSTHADCDEIEPQERPAVICHQCWLTKPCGCEDDT